jgi:hypothetical protein
VQLALFEFDLIHRSFAVIDSWSTFGKWKRIGNSYDFGSFDLCVNIRHETELGLITGKFCMIQYFSKSNQTASLGPSKSWYNFGWRNIDRRFGAAVCIPEVCPDEVSRQLVKNLMAGSDLAAAENYNQSENCKPSVSSRSTSKLLVVLCVSSMTLLVLNATATIYDFKLRKFPHKRNPWLIAFSLYSNGSNLFNVIRTNDTLPSLYCIRFLATIFVTFMHAFGYRFLFPAFDSTVVTQFLTGVFRALVIFNATSVEIFFVLSGLIATKSTMKSMKK